MIFLFLLYILYRRGQVIVDDSNRTPWIQLVKTGRVRVVREQNVLDIDSCDAYKVDAEKRPDDPLGTKATAATHANGMWVGLIWQPSGTSF